MSPGHVPPSTCLGSGWVTSTEGEELASSVLGIISARAESSHQSECVRHNTCTKGKDKWTEALNFLQLPFFTMGGKKRSVHISPSPDPKWIPTVPGLPTLARNRQVVCKDPIASPSCFLHKPRHRELMQGTAFEECLKGSVNRAWRISLVKGRKNQYGYLKCNAGG